LGRCHDLQTVMEAALILRDDPIRFAFIGAGAKLSECLAFVDLHQLENCVFLPFQPKEVLPFSLTACDLNLVSVSEESEGLVAPSKFYGCLAAGKAIAAVCSSHSYLRDIIDAAQCGKAITNQDGEGLAEFIRELQQNPALSQTMGDNGRAYLEKHFTLSEIADQYLKVIQNAKLS
ncbi:MAG: glycosyltransferase, partial [Synechocystis sp.]|nr:glycosyltransferase [Synechocystis sp.]